MRAAARSWPTRRTTDVRLLLVEDDRALAGELQPILETTGYAVDRAHDGEDALYLG